MSEAYKNQNAFLTCEMVELNELRDTDAQIIKSFKRYIYTCRVIEWYTSRVLTMNVEHVFGRHIQWNPSSITDTPLRSANCPFNGLSFVEGSISIIKYQNWTRKMSLVARCPLFRGVLYLSQNTCCLLKHVQASNQEWRLLKNLNSGNLLCPLKTGF